MQPTRLEHVNITVRNIERSTRFLLAALPGWRVRGEGRMDWFGTSIAWRHVGDDDFYVALQDGGQGEVMDWQSLRLGPKHLGLVVPSVDAAVARLQAAGYPLDHWGGSTPARRSVYVVDPDSVQFEFVEYLSDDVAARNAYTAA
jgi:catechol 2,3-dioxygenase-like lactoylglutathione lyase family enzyme